MVPINQYGVFEITMPKGTRSGYPEGVFSCGGRSVRIKGFAENTDVGVVRFMPETRGDWHYDITWEGESVEGDFLCTEPKRGVHGPVRAQGRHFRYDDGARFIPIGTTCYAWVHQLPEVIDQTLETLKSSPFNKVRMCIFPKSMPYNQNDPALYPFEKKENGAWDVTRPDQQYWKHLDRCVCALAEIGIEADIILFHPYDRWGFSAMAQEDNLLYLQYAIRRLAAYHNVWWALSNEYEFSFGKTIADWDQFGEMLAAEDPYHHLISAHDWITPYPKRAWMTHVSLQCGDPREVFGVHEEYGLPTIDDELGYEGDLEFAWGNLSGFEFMNRVWAVAAFGCYSSHGETFHREDEVLWWAKGGKLYGEAPARLKFFKNILESLPGPMEPFCAQAVRDPNGNANSEGQKQLIKMIWEMESDKGRRQIQKEMTKPIGQHPDFRLIYLERQIQSFISLSLPEQGSYKVEVIDIWKMTRKQAVSGVRGNITVGLPGCEGIAVLITRLNGEALW